MPRDAVSRTAHVGTWLRKRSGGKKWVKVRGLIGMRGTRENTDGGVRFPPKKGQRGLDWGLVTSSHNRNGGGLISMDGVGKVEVL